MLLPACSSNPTMLQRSIVALSLRAGATRHLLCQAKANHRCVALFGKHLVSANQVQPSLTPALRESGTAKQKRTHLVPQEPSDPTPTVCKHGNHNKKTFRSLAQPLEKEELSKVRN